MITEQDLAQAIAECQGERHPNANTCIKLAAFLTIRNELFGDKEENHFADDSKMEVPQEYSFAGPQVEENSVAYESGTEFGQAINGKRQDKVFSVLDELMSTLQIVNTRLYDAVMRRL